jgi:hypothetical protein
MIIKKGEMTRAIDPSRFDTFMKNGWVEVKPTTDKPTEETKVTPKKK